MGPPSGLSTAPCVTRLRNDGCPLQEGNGNQVVNVNDMRVGLGFDSHRFAEGRPLMLGGVRIPFDKGLEGHSDADVVLHAVIDALLGAAALPDIGEQFPDGDPAYRGVASTALLNRTLALLSEAGFEPNNVDIVVIAERPKLSSHKEAMRASIAALLGLDVNRVGVKAKTAEGMDAIGRSEGMACMAVASIRTVAAR